MYLLADTSTVIACSQERAFDYTANLEHFPQWFPGVLAIVSSDGAPPATVGKRYRETVAVPLRGRRSVHIRVIESDSPRRLVTEGSLAALLPRMEIECEALGPGSCRVHWRMWSRNTQAWARWTALTLARRVMTRRAWAGLRALKSLLEQAPPAP